MNKHLLLLHGPNLNLLGLRDPKIYGTLTLREIEEITLSHAQQYDLQVIAYQSNYEGALIDKLQTQDANRVGLIINPGALTHYSYALYDAIVDTKLPAIEVHLSNIKAREKWRHHSVISPACIHTITGKQVEGYKEAVQLLYEYLHHAHRP